MSLSGAPLGRSTSLRLQLPDVSAMAGVPEIFSERSGTTSIRRALILGNGVAGAEHQCLGLVRALGLEATSQLQRVIRPRGGIHEFLHWLPIRAHRYLAMAVGVLNGDAARRQLEALLLKRVPRLLPGRPVALAREDGQLTHVKTLPSSGGAEADPKAIAEWANKELDGSGPLLVVASGRDTIEAALMIKSGAPQATFVVQIQHPRHGVEQFDIVIAPMHDFYALTKEAQLEVPAFVLKWIRPSPPSKNVVLTIGALHHADAPALRAAAAKWHEQLACLPRPLIVVNIGGPQRYCKYGKEVGIALVQALRLGLLAKGSARISFSRRTPAFVCMSLLT